MIINKKRIQNIIFIICLITLAVGWRIINHNYQFAPNLELVTAVSVLSAIIFGWRIALIVPITTMIISDIMIGNSSIFIFTWGSFAIIGLSALVLRKLNAKPKIQILSSVGFAVASTFLFFVVTNFGVWLQGWYPMTWAGLVDCFVMAIPFYRTMLIGNIILVPSVVIVWQVIKARQKDSSLVINSLVGK